MTCCIIGKTSTNLDSTVWTGFNQASRVGVPGAFPVIHRMAEPGNRRAGEPSDPESWSGRLRFCRRVARAGGKFLALYGGAGGRPAGAGW
jgi:hypothetical protein